MSEFSQASERVRQLVGLGRLDQAMEQALRLQRDFPEAVGQVEVLLSAIHLHSGRFSEAQSSARVVIAELPHYAGGYRLLAAALASLGDVPQAVGVLRDGLRVDPEATEIRLALAELLAETDPDEALSHAQQAVRLQPDIPEGFSIIGAIVHDSDPDAARQAYLLALQQDPHDAQSHYNLATLAAFKTGDWESAVDSLSRVLAQDPSSPAPVLLLDQKVWLTIRSMFFTTLLGLFIFWVATRSPVTAVCIAAATIVGSILLARRGLRPIRTNLPGRGSRFLRSFPDRNRIETVALGALVGAWLAMLVTSVASLVSPAAAPLMEWGAGIGAVCLVVMIVLARVRLSHLKARVQKLLPT